MATDDHTRPADDALNPTAPSSSQPTESHESTSDDHSTSADYEPRTYIEIRPSATSLDYGAITQAVDLLYDRLEEASKTDGWSLSLLGRSTEPPVVEWLLVADGQQDTSIRYLVGTSEEALLEDLESILRTEFPKTFELQYVEWHPRDIEANLSTTQRTPTSRRESERTEDANTADDRPYAAGVEYRGHATLRRDWQTSLTSFDEITDSNSTTNTDAETHSVPLATLVETLCDASVPVVYQAVCRPFGDQRPAADEYRFDLERGIVTPGDKLIDFVFATPTDETDDDTTIPAMYRDRLENLRSRELRRTFALSARAVALTRDDPQRADRIADRLTRVFGHLSGPFHEIRSTVRTDADRYTGVGQPPGTQLFDEILERTCHDPGYDTLGTRLPGRAYESGSLVVSPDELPGFCLLDGTGLTPNGTRALGIRHSERTGLSLPAPTRLARYTGPGQALCRPLTADRQPAPQPFVLPPSLQDRHLFVIGDTGSGKSVLTIGALISNVDATDGPEILFDYKGGNTAEEYLQAHYGTRGDLETVRYFDLTDILPAISFFDIRPLLEAGLSREEARSRVAGQYEEILAGLVGSERYYQATESTKAIRNHLRALYDPIHGSETVSHADLYESLQRTLSDRTPPPTSDERLSDYFAGLLERDHDVFNKILGGAVARVETIATDDRLAPLFDYVHTPANETDTDASTTPSDETDADDSSPHFAFTDVIDEDCVVVFDFGGMEERIKRALTLVLLSNLWTALKARAEDPETPRDPPLVNLYLEEARDVAATQLVDTLLSQGRSFGLSILLGVQFPGQLSSPDPSNNTYEEALNEIGTFVVGNVSIEDDLAKTLATDDVPPRRVARRLAAIRHGEWLVRPAAEFGAPTPRPFLGRSLPAPDGHPASDIPLSADQRNAFETAFELTALETWNASGLAHQPDPTRVDRPETEMGPTVDYADDTHSEPTSLRVDSLLPHTTRLPDCLDYDGAMHALCCDACDSRYDPNLDGMRRAVDCCHTLEDVDADDIPVCDVTLKLTPDERAAAEWTDRQLLFLQVVYNAQQRRYEPPEYDLLTDSMLRLQEYVGIETDEIEPLLEADLLRHDTDYPHRLYTVSPEGRSVIGESYRKGVDYGHGTGDLEESSQHVFGIEIARRYLEDAYANDPDSRVSSVIPYYELDNEDQHRLDVAAIDDQDDIVVTVEVERINHDAKRAIPEDYDKMAACDPEEAIWLVMKQAAGHKVLSALNDPAEGEPRVEKTYAKTTPPFQFQIDTPGLTAIYPVEWLRKRTAADEYGRLE
ncbi:ATP-binding protein [Halomontanus rarus]|uniref:ATP-binding protein n=1 Tax=Halomontanus rarus TaxID=3034020 RepID=UPI001A9851C8